MKNCTAGPGADASGYHEWRPNGAAVPARSGFTGPVQAGTEFGGPAKGENRVTDRPLDEEKWAGRFEALLDKGDANAGRSDSREMPSPFSGDGVPAGLNMPPRAEADDEPGAAECLIRMAAQKIADTFLTSNPGGPGAPQVRFFIRIPRLRGTEVRILEKNGRICLTLIPSEPDARGLLLAHRADLKQRLKCRTGKKICIEIV